jgi:RNA polymerase sigma factor for flagellar operon FliA
MGDTAAVQTSALIERHRSYARALAAEILRKLPPHAEREELEGAADLGLVEAAGAFDPSRGVQFKTFAYYRIRGAVYDCIRRVTWLSKSDYDKLRFEAAANDYLGDYTAGAEAEPSPEQAIEEVRRLTDPLATAYLLSLEAEGVKQPEDPNPGAEEQLLESEQRGLLREALGKLPERNRVAIEFYYYQGLTLDEVGKKIGLSKSRTSRVVARSVDMLRDLLAGTTGPLLSVQGATLGRSAR